MTQEISRILTQEEHKRLKVCEAGIEKGLKTFVETGQFLLEIRDNKLYREEYGTFELYCQKKWNIVRQHANRLIAGARVMKNLEPMGSKNLPERTVRPLAKLPVPEQKKAFKVATETAKAEGREVTGKDVEEAVKKSTPPPLVKIVDSVGRVIPKNLIELWNTREDPLEVCKLLSEARSLLKKAEETSNKAFSNIHLQTEIANVSGLYTRIKESVYYAVCGLCQGVGCKACKRGLMSRQQWEQLVPKETKDMILKGIKK